MSVISDIQNNLKNNEAAIIVSPSNRFYITGFSSSDGYVVITGESAVFLTDSRYIESARQKVKSCSVTLLKNTYADLTAALGKSENVYIETGYITVEQLEKLEKSLPQFCFLRDNMLDNIITNSRIIKNEREIENIIAAQKLTDDTFNYILNNIKVGKTEREIALDMEFFMRKCGSEGVSFDFIVVSGKNSSLPHGVPTDKKIENGDFVTMDFGAVVNGYRSDMTRTVAVGRVTQKQKQVYDTVLKAQTAAIKCAKAGKVCKDIDKIARDIIKDAGYGENFGHGLGHGVGIDIHESPCFNTRDETVLKPNTVITVEPGIYIENQFGVRIEDMIIIGDNGNTDITKSSKELIVL